MRIVNVVVGGGPHTKPGSPGLLTREPHSAVNAHLTSPPENLISRFSSPEGVVGDGHVPVGSAGQDWKR